MRKSEKELMSVLSLAACVIGNPSIADTGPITNPTNGHTYKSVSVAEGIDWYDAEAATSLGIYHLATIQSANEQAFIVSNLPEVVGAIDSFGYWFGGRGDGTGTFYWVTGEAFDYTNWNPVFNEPNGDTDPAIHFFGYIGSMPVGAWNDANAGYWKFPGYVLEIEPDNIVIDGCDSGTANALLESGYYMSFKVGACADNAINHGAYVSCVSELTNYWMQSDLISGKQKGKIQQCAAHANIP